MTHSLLSSEMLARIIDGSPIASFVINNQHKVIHWNTAIEALSGIKRQRIIGTDQQWRAFYAKERPTMADLIVDGAPAAEIEAHYSRGCRESYLIAGAFEAEAFFPDLGREGKWLHFTASPIKDSDGVLIGAIETLEDITERKDAEENLHYYLQEITRAQEDERKRIARELHDDTVQMLGSLSRQLDNFIRKKHNLSKQDVALLKEMQEQLNRGTQEVHRFSQALRLSVLDDFGLVPALRSLVKSLQDYQGITTDLKIAGRERRFPSEVELTLFRISQEGLSNVGRHAQASEASLELDFSKGRVRVVISDNGRGFELPDRLDDLPRSGKLGLTGIQERARLLGGTLEVRSAQGRGTTLIVDVPI